MIRFQKDPKIRKSTWKLKKNMNTRGIEVLRLIVKKIKPLTRLILAAVEKKKILLVLIVTNSLRKKV